MDVRGVSEGGASISVPPRGPFPPARYAEAPLCAAARAPRDFASETFRGFCGRARGRGERGPRAQGGGCEGGGSEGAEGPAGRGATRGNERSWKRGLGGKTTVFPLIERLARGAEERASRGSVEGRITCSNYLFLLRSASPCLARQRAGHARARATRLKIFSREILRSDG